MWIFCHTGSVNSIPRQLWEVVVDEVCTLHINSRDYSYVTTTVWATVEDVAVPIWYVYKYSYGENEGIQ